MRRVYLDNNATTKTDEKVLEAMLPYFCEVYGNAHSMHSFGQEAGKALNSARETISNILKIEKSELIFTGTGVESNNLAIRGIARAYRRRGNHIITSAIEHPGAKNTCQDLEREGFEVSYIPVDKNGVVIVEELKKAIRKETILVTLMHANNETGVVQPIEEISKITRENKIVFHTDAVQTVGKIPVYPKELGVDLMSFSGHKFNGPKGTAGLFVKNGIRLGKVITGGGQERKIRPGTTNLAGVVGMAKALELATTNMDEKIKEEEELRAFFETEMVAKIPEIKINGKEAVRLPGTSSISFRHLEGESILLGLDYKGIAVSSGSACSSDDLQASHVLLAMGIEVVDAHGTIRFSLGKFNTREDMEYVIEEAPKVIEKLRMISPLWNEFQLEK
ncbi:cysteine desulfurase family protein [Psychrilyobacter atlanticus]|uniref:cysteine desulfurase family protein n=1 Tax=Psychrilyobacter atlanticus TaxID=271091 RepID=UPI00041D75D4|nr:cysteine desulfurase family protein [Psychrilyobacter atlanticus]